MEGKVEGGGGRGREGGRRDGWGRRKETDDSRQIRGKEERRKIDKCKMCPLDLHFYDFRILFVF